MFNFSGRILPKDARILCLSGDAQEIWYFNYEERETLFASAL